MLHLCCGHTVEHFYEAYPVSIKDAEYDANTHSLIPVVKHMEVCKDCYSAAIANDLVLLTREAEENYLRNGL